MYSGNRVLLHSTLLQKFRPRNFDRKEMHTENQRLDIKKWGEMYTDNQGMNGKKRREMYSDSQLMDIILLPGSFS